MSIEIFGVNSKQRNKYTLILYNRANTLPQLNVMQINAFLRLKYDYNIQCGLFKFHSGSRHFYC